MNRHVAAPRLRITATYESDDSASEQPTISSRPPAQEPRVHPTGAEGTPNQPSTDQALPEGEEETAYFQPSDSTFQPKLASIVMLAMQNFVVELGELLGTLRRRTGVDPPVRFTPPDVLGLHLSNEAVMNREREREFKDGVSPASPFVRLVYTVTCQILDVMFENRPIPRFWVLETVARMPYFAYSSCLHLYSTLGWYRSPTMMNMHHAEELNEAYHLAVMESLGGDKAWPVSCLRQHTSCS